MPLKVYDYVRGVMEKEWAAPEGHLTHILPRTYDLGGTLGKSDAARKAAIIESLQLFCAPKSHFMMYDQVATEATFTSEQTGRRDDTYNNTMRCDHFANLVPQVAAAAADASESTVSARFGVAVGVIHALTDDGDSWIQDNDVTPSELAELVAAAFGVVVQLLDKWADVELGLEHDSRASLERWLECQKDIFNAAFSGLEVQPDWSGATAAAAKSKDTATKKPAKKTRSGKVKEEVPAPKPKKGGAKKEAKPAAATKKPAGKQRVSVLTGKPIKKKAAKK